VRSPGSPEAPARREKVVTSVAKARAGTAKRENRLVRYLKETRVELGKVSWPSRQETINLTLIVLAVTTFMAALLGFLDYLFAQIFALVI
jgi:preprotein translocase subunit SecE